MKKATSRALKIFLGFLLLYSIVYFAFTKNAVIIIASIPLHVTRLDSFIINSEQGRTDTINLIFINRITEIQKLKLSVNSDKIILMSSDKFTDKGVKISKVADGKEIRYILPSIERRTSYILLQYKKVF